MNRIIIEANNLTGQQTMIITTTNSIENGEIERYFGVISTNVVIGTNVFSDFAASFTDFFGGTSETYQKKLDIIYKSGIDALSQKATLLGANCIIGLSVDFDEISGKGKSMFMISVIGTAAKVIIKRQVEEKALSSSTIISADQLTSEYFKRDLIARVESGGLLSSEDWSFLSNYPVSELAPFLLDRYLNMTSMSTSENEELLNKNFPHYLGRLDKKIALKLISDNIGRNESDIIKLVKANNLFDTNLVINEIEKDELDTAVHLLDANKDSYTNEDLLAMKKIISLFDNIPDKGKVEMVKGVFSKGEEKYICPCGHKNPTSQDFCQEYGCGLNIKGLTQYQIKRISAFKLKVQSLEALLKV